MNGERAERNGKEKVLTKKPFPNNAMGINLKYAKKHFWHRMRRFLAKEIKDEVASI